MRILILPILLMLGFTAFGQTNPPRNWVDSEVRYADSSGTDVTVYSSLPKGGGRYTGADGKVYSYVIFWFRIVNQSVGPVDVTMNFPAAPLTIFHSTESHIRIFLPPDTMTLAKIQLYDYGLVSLQTFLKDGFNKPGMLRRTIKSKEEFLFYVPVLFYEARGSARAALVLKGQDLYFRISVGTAVDGTLIPCGKLVIKH